MFAALHLLEQATRAGAPLSPGQGRFRAETLGRRGDAPDAGRPGRGVAPRGGEAEAALGGVDVGAQRRRRERATRGKSPEAASRAEVKRMREIFFSPPAVR